MEYPMNDENAVGYFYGVFYNYKPEGKENSPEYWIEWCFLAAFNSEEKAIEYASRSVWNHLETMIRKQPIY